MKIYSDLILKKKVSSPATPYTRIPRATEHSLCDFSHFSQSPVPHFCMQHVEKETNVGQLQGEGSQKRRKDKGAAAAAAGGSDWITVLRLSSQVEGKCQKYSRIGPLTLVPLDQEPSLEIIKKACQLHFYMDLV